MMPYYGMGDYYQGDYYQGDPGILGSLVKLGGKALSSFTPVGRIASTALSIGRRVLGRPAAAAAIGMAAPMAVSAIARRGISPPIGPTAPGIPLPGGISFRPTRILPGGQPAFQPTDRPAGYHWSETAGRWVRNRSMNVTNPRALRRAIRRARGFAKLARRVLTFVQPRAPKGKAIFKRKK